MTDKLAQASLKFLELSKKALQPQTNAKIRLSPQDLKRKKDIKLWSNTLMAAVRATAGLLNSPNAAKNLFNQIAPFRSHPGAIEPQPLRNIDSIRAALDLSTEKLEQFGINPLDVMRQAGMQNLNNNTLNVLKKNIQTIFDGKDFSQYTHYTLAVPGQPTWKDVIELDDPESDKNNPGY